MIMTSIVRMGELSALFNEIMTDSDPQARKHPCVPIIHHTTSKLTQAFGACSLA